MLNIDRLSTRPIYEQVIDQVKKLVLVGILLPDESLPSVRKLSRDLSVNPNTLQKAYTHLESKGICYSVPGTGRFVSADARSIIQNEQRQRINELSHLVSGLAMAGVSLDEIKNRVEQAYHSNVSKTKEVVHDKGE